MGSACLAPMFEAVRLVADDLRAIEPQPSQRFTLGIDTRAVSDEEAGILADQPEAWALHSRGRLLACFGIQETFPGVQGVAWAVLGDNVGSAHLAMTRFARARIAQSRLARIEAIVRASDAERVLTRHPDLDAAQLLMVVMAVPTPECTWARLVGLRPAHVLRRFGAAGETHLLFERFG